MHIVAHMNDLANLGRQGTTDTSTTSPTWNVNVHD
jgi:hypothetical protein